MPVLPGGCCTDPVRGRRLWQGPALGREVYIQTRGKEANLTLPAPRPPPPQICALLSKTAFPVSGPLAAVHLLSLDGILAILSSLAAGATGDGLDAGDDAAPPLADPPAYVDIWGPLCRGLHPPVAEALGLAAPGTTGAGASSPGDPAGAAESARLERYLKGRLATAAEHFNRDQKKGFQYLQAMHLLPAPLDPGAVARFLRGCPGLAKPAIGEVLGERDAFYEGVRDAFLSTFDFGGLDFDVALRLFMDAFRPPGEGQKIDRIMQVCRGWVGFLVGVGVRV